MTLRSLLFVEDVDQSSLFARGNELQGSTLGSVRWEGDSSNRISVASAAVSLSKAQFKANSPYYMAVVNDDLILYPTFHFLKELRRQLSGNVLGDESLFSDTEQLLYEQYQEWAYDTSTYSDSNDQELVLALETLDKWLVDEVQNITHPELNREYKDIHPWVKLGTRE